MVQLAVDMSWSYVLLVYSNDSYGRTGAELINAFAKNRGICISNSIAIEDWQEPSSYKDVSIQIRDDPANGIIYFGHDISGMSISLT